MESEHHEVKETSEVSDVAGEGSEQRRVSAGSGVCRLWSLVMVTRGAARQDGGHPLQRYAHGQCPR